MSIHGAIRWILCGVAASAAAGAGATDFAFEQTYVDLDYGGNGKPGWVRTGDMDRDGDIDIVAGGGNALFIYENDGAAGGWTRHGSLGNPGANGAELVDVDGDLDLDVVSARNVSNLWWWENPGGPLATAPWTAHQFGTTSWFLHDMLRADLDGNPATLEILCVVQNGYWNAPYSIYWFRPGADPEAAWTQHVVTENQAGPNNNHSGIDAADIDGDTDIDIAFSNGWFESPGSPEGAWTWHPVTSIYGVSNCLARDVDRDTHMDLVMSAGHHGQGLYWFENDGDENFTQHTISPVSGDIFARKFYETGADYLHHPEGLLAADLDGDLDLDFAVCELFFGEDAGEPDWSDELHHLYIYENLGDDNPTWREIDIAPDSFPSHQIQFADIDKDNRLDIVSEGAGYKVVSLYKNITGDPPPPPRLEISFGLEVVDGAYPGNGRPGWSAAGDLDGDDEVDVVAGGGGAIQWYEAPGWTRHSLEASSSAGGNGGLVLDVDRDGDRDVVAALFNDALVWWENPRPGGTATGTWARRTISTDGEANNYNHDLAAGNLDADADLEIVGLYVGGGVYWYDPPADPAAGAWPKTRILATIADPFVGLALGDIDRDGDMDVVAANRWYEHPNGAPATPDWTGRDIFPGAVQNVYCYDVNRDGRLDVVAAEGFVNPNGRVLWAEAPLDPKTEPWIVREARGGLDGPENIWAGDLNYDGFTDLLSGEMGTSTGFGDSDSNIFVLEGTARAATAWRHEFLATGVGVSARLNPIDIDGDGDWDFTADGNAEDHIYLWRNTTPTIPAPDTNALIVD